MTRAQALALLTSANAEISYDVLDEVFGCFGFDSLSPTFETEVYYHARFHCGRFTARDDGLHILTDEQKRIVLGMVRCVELHEKLYPKPTG